MMRQRQSLCVCVEIHVENPLCVLIPVPSHTVLGARGDTRSMAFSSLVVLTWYAGWEERSVERNTLNTKYKHTHHCKYTTGWDPVE